MSKESYYEYNGYSDFDSTPSPKLFVEKTENSTIQTKEKIVNTLKEIKPKYQKEGIDILGLFGSYAKGTENEFSDIDIAYNLDFQKMLKQQDNNSFRVLFRLEDITKELQKLFQKKVDFVPDNNKEILKGIIYV